MDMADKMDEIKISLSEKKGGGAISEIRVDGVVDTLTASELEQVIESLIGRGRYQIMIDLAGVEYISSAGWGILIAHIREVRASGGDIKLANMQPDVLEVFELLEFDNVLHSFTSVREAVDAFDIDTETGGSTASPKSSGRAKKKEHGEGRIAVVDEIGATSLSDSVQDYGYPDNSRLREPRDIDTTVLCYVKSDPFAAISEIRNHVNSTRQDQTVGWWQVFTILRRHRLIRRKSRFRLAWGRI